MRQKTLLFSFLLAAGNISNCLAQAAVNLNDETAIIEMTSKSFDNFKANKWHNFGEYWGWQEANGDGYRYYWEQALCTMATANIAEYGTNEDATTVLKQNLDGFLVKYGDGVGVGWNEHIDDLGWVQCAYALGYRITRNPKYLNKAKRLFNTGFTRGNLGPYKGTENTVKDGSEGLWWRVPASRWQPNDELATSGTEGDGYVIKNQDFYKSPLAVSPHVTTGAYIYSFTGEEEYLNKAIKLWQWEVNTLWVDDDDSGLYEGYDTYRAEIVDKDGNTQPERPEGFRTRRTMHDLSSFFEATNALWMCTGEEVYLAWCWKIVNTVLQYRLDQYGIIQNAFNARDGSWCWEAGRAWTMFCADNGLWDFKGQVPTYEGTYEDYTGKSKAYTSKVKGKLNTIPNGWTLYQFMAASASRIQNSNSTCIILPTNREVDVWSTKGKTTQDLEAEEAAFENKDGNEPIVAAKDAQASDGYTAKNVGNGNWLKFTTDEMRQDYYTIYVSYASDTETRLTVRANGEAATVDCPATGGNRFRQGHDTVSVVLPLVQGVNTIEVGSDDATCPFIDKIFLRRVTGINIPTNGEAEGAVLDEGVTITKDNQASDGNTVTGLGDGRWLSFTYKAPASAYYTVNVQYASEMDRHLAIQANGGEVEDLLCAKTGDGNKFRNGYGTVTFVVYLNAGNNTIKLGLDSGEAPVLDKYTVTFSSFKQEATGIDTVTTPSAGNAEARPTGWFTPQGIRVAKPSKKGLYIKDGKKVIVK